MKFHEHFPLCFYLNLGERDERRALTEREFFLHGLKVQRFPAINARWLKESRGFENKGRYAHALSQRLAIRQAKKHKAEALVLFEDDVVLHPHFKEWLDKVQVPDDWELLYFGGFHIERPEYIAPGLVRCQNTIDTHAFAIRSSIFDRVLSALKPPPRSRKRKGSPAADRILAGMQKNLNAYACFPNLAWQRLGHSDLLNRKACNYEQDGYQRQLKDVLSGLTAQTLSTQSSQTEKKTLAPRESSIPHLAFLFPFTETDDAHSNFWRSYLQTEDLQPISLYAGVSREDEPPPNRVHGFNENSETALPSFSSLQETLELLNSAFTNSCFTHFVVCPKGTLPIKTLEQLSDYLREEPRSIFGYEKPLESPLTEIQQPNRLGINAVVPSSLTYRQSLPMILTREAALVILRHDFTSYYEKCPQAVQLYFATVLNLNGFPLSKKIRNLCPAVPFEQGNDKIDGSLPSQETFLDWKYGPHFFTHSVSLDYVPNWSIRIRKST